MLFNKQVMIVFGVSNMLALISFILLISYAGRGTETYIIIIFGWMFWLGIFSLIAPFIVGPNFMKDCLQKKYLGGTIIITIIYLIILVSSAWFVAVLENKL